MYDGHYKLLKDRRTYYSCYVETVETPFTCVKGDDVYIVVKAEEEINEVSPGTYLGKNLDSIIGIYQTEEEAKQVVAEKETVVKEQKGITEDVENFFIYYFSVS